MDNKLLDRINALAKKQKEQGLTEQEIQERDNLRKEYLKQFRAGMTNILESTYIQKTDGTLEKLHKK
ncbi:DUF896 domain-containing protein [Clostridium sp. MD294]|uniref:DUF896 domain-containing protein n=1 Tax=Clostridium sp. MD294 TaxID=97138 RepID=UPI0002C8E6B4|nr:DUF896 domain-containing protein [Clostridium sp. MD294]NDO45764.1 DUF896 domain-containing protein [Clostridium sp. MD294]USF30581.1 hypothetical protein C820_002023 [Clostridium sp. MD294]